MPLENQLPKTIHARVHEDAITRVTRFFDATTAETLNELFQNARRANASHVDVTIAGGEIAVADDGHGISHPAAVLAFGQSRWSGAAARREDPAGMGVYALARRARVTIRSRPRPTNGTRLPAWQVHLTPEHFLGQKAASIEVISDESMPYGTEVVFDDDETDNSNISKVKWCGQYFPLPVSCNGQKLDRMDFLHDAIHIEEWRGIRLGVRAQQYPPGRRFELNFHGLLIENVQLPAIDSMNANWNVKADVIDCNELELVLPARKTIIETPFTEELRNTCRGAIYRGMLQMDPRIDVPASVHADALTHDVKLPIAKAQLAPWKPRSLNRQTRWSNVPLPANLPEDPIVIGDYEIPIADQHAFWRAAQRAGISRRLCAPEPRYRGYAWYDKLPMAARLTSTVTLEGCDLELEVETQRQKRIPMQTARPHEITFKLHGVNEKHGTTVLSIPGDVAFPDDDVNSTDELRVLVTTGNTITAEELGELMYEAFFAPSDDFESDSYETQKKQYRQGAYAAALEVLASAEEAILANVRTAVDENVTPCLPPRTNAVIRIRYNGRTEVSIEVDD